MSETSMDLHDSQNARLLYIQKASGFLVSQFGSSPHWLAINQALWERFSEKGNTLTPSDIDHIVSKTSCEERDVMSVIGLMSASTIGFLQPLYVDMATGKEVQQYEVWRKAKDPDWNDYASNIGFSWVPGPGLKNMVILDPSALDDGNFPGRSR